MKYLNNEFDLGAESDEDASTSVEALEAQLGAVGIEWGRLIRV